MDETIEIFGKRLKVVKDEDGSCYFCEECAIKVFCLDMRVYMPICEDANGETNRHFELVKD